MTVMFCVHGLLLLVLLEKGAFKSNFVSRGEEQQRGEGRRVFGEVVVTSCAHKPAAKRLQSTELLEVTSSRPRKIHWDVQNVSELRCLTSHICGGTMQASGSYGHSWWAVSPVLLGVTADQKGVWCQPAVKDKVVHAWEVWGTGIMFVSLVSPHRTPVARPSCWGHPSFAQRSHGNAPCWTTRQFLTSPEGT